MLRFSLEVFLGCKFLKLRSIISPYVSLIERRKSSLFDLHARIFIKTKFTCMHPFIPTQYWYHTLPSTSSSGRNLWLICVIAMTSVVSQLQGRQSPKQYFGNLQPRRDRYFICLVFSTYIDNVTQSNSWGMGVLTLGRTCDDMSIC